MDDHGGDHQSLREQRVRRVYRHSGQHGPDGQRSLRGVLPRLGQVQRRVDSRASRQTMAAPPLPLLEAGRDVGGRRASFDGGPRVPTRLPEGHGDDVHGDEEGVHGNDGLAEVPMGLLRLLGHRTMGVRRQSPRKLPPSPRRGRSD